MSAIAQHRPRFSGEDAVRIAQTLYDITASVRPLPSDRDQNFHLTTPAGEEFVLKIANSAEQQAVLDFQNRVLEHLTARQGDGIWPRVCSTTTGGVIGAVNGPDGSAFFVRLLTYLPGKRLVDVRPHTPDLLRSFGEFLGRMSRALEGLSHPAVQQELKWNPDNAPAVIRDYAGSIPDPQWRSLVMDALARYEAHVVPALPSLRRSVIQNDANDYNVLVASAEPDDPRSWAKRVVGLIDFGDMVISFTVCDLAVALAYVMLGKADPLAAAEPVVSGYHAESPLTEQELALLYDFIRMRLCLSVAISARQQQDEPENPYLSVSEEPAWELLEQLRDLHPNVAHYTFRHACGLPPCPQTAGVVDWLKAHAGRLGAVMGPDVDVTNAVVFDLSVGSLDLALVEDRSDTQAFTDFLFRRVRQEQASVGIGRYDEPRLIYASDQYRVASDELPERRTIHIGLDLFLEPGSPIFAPLDGVVQSFQNNAAPLDYGPTIILEHRMAGDIPPFYTLYGHLSLDSLDGLSVGMPVKKGDRIARIGDPFVNGGWPPHLHFQIITDLLGKRGDFPGVAAPGQRDIYLSLCPDPNLIVGVPENRFPARGRSQDDILRLRRRHIGKSLSISYRTPLKIVRGLMQYLYDAAGRAYLDAVNNVPHVGHCHPRVVRAGQRQMAVLNTNTRYLYDHVVDYAERLCATFPEPLRVCFFVNSGSEANDLALRLARAYTGQRDILIVDGAYHGNLTSLIEVSPYKFDGPGGSGAPPHVHTAIMPDPYRGPYKGTDPEAGTKYARHIQEAIHRVRGQGRGVCGFLAESLLGCGGQIVLPDNYFTEAFRHVRDAGGVCIVDEVQVGFGRVGTHVWGFETQGVVPDIVTLGKPIGNGHPLAAVITTPDIADAFANGMEYFNTFGGNPVSCAIGMAVLDVMRDERLQENALKVGARLKTGLERLMAQYPLMGDVRGLGLFIGVELVLDRTTLEPAGDQASYIANRMKDHGILMSTDGPLHNVLKIKPPLVFTEENADVLVRTLEKVLQEDFVQPR